MYGGTALLCTCIYPQPHYTSSGVDEDLCSLDGARVQTRCWWVRETEAGVERLCVLCISVCCTVCIPMSLSLSVLLCLCLCVCVSTFPLQILPLLSPPLLTLASARSSFLCALFIQHKHTHIHLRPPEKRLKIKAQTEKWRGCSERGVDAVRWGGFFRTFIEKTFVFLCCFNKLLRDDCSNQSSYCLRL